MRWSTYISPVDQAEHAGLLRDGELYGLRGPASLIELIGDGGARLAAAREEALNDPFEVLPASSVRLLAPIPRPPSIRDFTAFEEHMRNASRGMGRDVAPVWYEVGSGPRCGRCSRRPGPSAADSTRSSTCLGALPKPAHPGAEKALAEIWNAEDKDHARAAVKAFAAAYGAKFPKAVAKIQAGPGCLSPSG
jgi:hypothetical protein